MHRSTARSAVCLLVAAALLGLGGCCSINPFSRCAPEFQLAAAAQADLNSCSDQGSYQVKLRIFSLSSVEAFRAAEFETLWFEESDLDGTVLDVQTLTIEPATRLEHVWLRPAGTRAVGVVANFCQLDSGCWKQLLDVSEGASKLSIDLAGTCMTAVARK